MNKETGNSNVPCILKMCLFPRLLPNPKYKPNKKNKFNPPIMNNERLKYVPIGCGNCIECKKQKAREWQVRLNEEIKTDKTGYFVTLTFSEESLNKLTKELKLNECNAVAGVAIRRFLERWRKKYKKSVKHWLITELGHQGTERLHLHGLIFTEHPEEIEKIWGYGMIFIGNYVNEKTINYIIKYVSKIDTDHKHFIQEIFCSRGLGAAYLKTFSAAQNSYNATGGTKEYYILPNGQKINLPIYYRNKIYTEEQRENLWIEKIEKGEIYIMGIKHSIKTYKEQVKYEKMLRKAQELNMQLGYGNTGEEWKRKDYSVTLRQLNKKR